MSENPKTRQVRAEGVTISELPAVASAQLNDNLEIQRDDDSHKVTVAQILGLAGITASDVRQDKANIFEKNNTFRQPITVADATADKHAVNKSQLEKVDRRISLCEAALGDLNDLTTTAKDNLVQAINEVNAKGGSGSTGVEIATTTSPGIMKFGTQEGQLQDSGEGLASLIGFDNLAKKQELNQKVQVVTESPTTETLPEGCIAVRVMGA